MIKLLSVSKTYETKKTKTEALKNIDLTLPSKGFISILGPSGCGKTTLLNLIGYLDKPSSGSITYNSINLSKMNEEDINSYRNNQVAFIFQEYYMIERMNVLDNIKLALLLKGYKDKKAEKISLKILEKIGIDDLKDKKINELSGGQIQRVAICRALVTDPKLILADEPTGALDSTNSESIMQLLKDASKTKAVIMVTHNEELARRYSDRIITLKDGEIFKDEIINNSEENEEKVELKKTHFPLWTNIKLAFKNIFSKKLNSILTCIANSFGMLGIGFLLALNHGFDIYSTNLSSLTASSLPVVITSYNVSTDTSGYGNYNNQTLYPTVSEVYPSISTNYAQSYTYNNFTEKYINYLNSLVDQGIAREVVVNYGTSYDFNLVTAFPESINSEYEGYTSEVNTTLSSYNSYASRAYLPTNIFHVLYGNMDEYDLLVGALPQNKNELVLVVDEYNSISFSILKALGFYNTYDSEDDVVIDNEVQGISFDDILNKKYKVFTDDEFYTTTYNALRTDALGNDRNMTFYLSDDIDKLYSDPNKGTELKITGIIRAKSTSPYAMLSPSLCYLPELQDYLVSNNSNSKIKDTFKNNVIFSPRYDKNIDTFITEIENVFTDYLLGKVSVLPTSTLNSILNDYFAYYVYDGYIPNSGLVSYSYGFNLMVQDAESLSIDLINDKYKDLNLSDVNELNNILKMLEFYLTDNIDEAYNLIISLASYLNTFSLIENIIVFPNSLETREILLNKLDDFNNISPGSLDHASNPNEQVFYSSLNNSAMINDVGNMISLVSIILIIFAIISLLVSCSMSAIMITNQVLERKKEIGLLRTLGFSKPSILSLFEFENLFIGLITSIIGSLVTFALSFPINSIIQNAYPSYQVGNICNFTFQHALIIVLISLIISFLSALIPSLKAANQKPVDCLRSE